MTLLYLRNLGPLKPLCLITSTSNRNKMEEKVEKSNNKDSTFKKFKTII